MVASDVVDGRLYGVSKDVKTVEDPTWDPREAHVGPTWGPRGAHLQAHRRSHGAKNTQLVRLLPFG